MKGGSTVVPKGSPFASPLRNPWRGCLWLWGRRILTEGSGWVPPPRSRSFGGGGAEGSGKRGSGMTPWDSNRLWGAGSCCSGDLVGIRHDLCSCPQRGVPVGGKGQVALPEWHSRVKLVDRNSSGTSLGSHSVSSYGHSHLPLTQLLALGILFFRPHSSPTGIRGIALQVWGMWEEGSEHLRSHEISVDTLGKIAAQPPILSGHRMI